MNNGCKNNDTKKYRSRIELQRKKVEKGKAECLHAANYLCKPKNMNFYQKLNGFTELNLLNKKATTKTLHISLNFSPSEKLPDKS